MSPLGSGRHQADLNRDGLDVVHRLQELGSRLDRVATEEEANRRVATEGEREPELRTDDDRIFVVVEPECRRRPFRRSTSRSRCSGRRTAGTFLRR